MDGKHGKMNIKFSENYDKETDIYYVTFKTGEPSYCEEVDDILVLEMGMFTNLPTGFRILNFSKHHVAFVGVKVIFNKIKKIIEENAHLKDLLQTREEQVKIALQEVLS